ncbi:hypothetical protein FCG67_01275 [Rhodococcus oryzae]|uniref:Zeta toxin domain-containing protein n=2 Tax=Rhodococcus oryzae TaxID=2571143 RepID=A0ABY2RQH4_9NOCA|nr:hypothetical protein FCG67_01275 [Rhodococcus oryzae]
MAWKPWAEELVGRLTAAGYSIQIVDVEAPQEVAAERIVSRWRQGFLAAAAEPANPGAQMGGRWIPRAAVDGLFTDLREHDGKPLHEKSVTEVNACEFSEESPSVTRYDLYRTKAVDRGADHIERHERAPGATCN